MYYLSCLTPPKWWTTTCSPGWTDRQIQLKTKWLIANYRGGGSFVCPGDKVKATVWAWRPSFLELYVPGKFPQLLKLTALCVQGDINADMLALTTYITNIVRELSGHCYYVLSKVSYYCDSNELIFLMSYWALYAYFFYYKILPFVWLSPCQK